MEGLTTKERNREVYYRLRRIEEGLEVWVGRDSYSEIASVEISEVIVIARRLEVNINSSYNSIS